MKTWDRFAALDPAIVIPGHGEPTDLAEVTRYTRDYPDYLAHANDNVMVSFILETREAMDALDEITRVAGVDALFLGLFDLCLSYGLDPMRMPHPEIDRLIDTVEVFDVDWLAGMSVALFRPDS